MLTRALYKNLNASWVVRWLRQILPVKYDHVDLDSEDHLRFTFVGEREDVVLDDGRCIKLFQKEAPGVVVPLLFQLCCLYDEQQETSEVLRQATAQLLGCTAGPAFFYWTDKYGEGVLTTMTLEGRRKQVGEVKVHKRKTDESAFTVLLPPSEWLCDTLLQHLSSQL